MKTKAESEPPPVFVSLEPGEPPTVYTLSTMTDPPDNHMIFSILTTVFCCFPVGIWAIIKSGEVDEAILRGDRSKAIRASNRARRLASTALIIGLLIVYIYVMLFIEALKQYVDRL